MRISKNQLRKEVRKIISEQTDRESNWPIIFKDGQRASARDLPPNVRSVVSLFKKIDPKKELMNSFRVRNVSAGWQVILYGEQYGHRRTRGRSSGYSSMGGDYTLIDTEPDVDDEVKLSWGIFAEIDKNGVITIEGRAGPSGWGEEEPEIISKGKRINSRKVEEWVEYNISSSGSDWQLEPFSTPPSKGGTSGGPHGTRWP